jgi:hypothetical protein
MTIANLLDQALRAQGIPIIGVSVGAEGDRATWTVQFDPSATPAHKALAATVLQSVSVDTVAQADGDAQATIDSRAIKAAVLTSLWGRLGRQPLAAEVSAERARFVQIYKTLA